MMDKATQSIYDILETVTDPEVPVLSILDLGIVRKVEEVEGVIRVTITPTYSGCPAMNVIATNIRIALTAAGYMKVDIREVLSPAWTTAWMTEAGKQKLKAYGIAPPEEGTIDKSTLFSVAKSVECPHCSSRNTEMISQFGSTACKAMYRCMYCQEPFDYFKCH